MKNKDALVNSDAMAAKLFGPDSPDFKKLFLDSLEKVIAKSNETDRMLDMHFSKRPIRITKLVDPVKLSAEIQALAKDYADNSKINKAKSYKAGFDNGWSQGYYEGLFKAADMVKLSRSGTSKRKGA